METYTKIVYDQQKHKYPLDSWLTKKLQNTHKKLVLSLTVSL
jgi:hypothetical protein